VLVEKFFLFFHDSIDLFMESEKFLGINHLMLT
jgi:hypothetical protein